MMKEKNLSLINDIFKLGCNHGISGQQLSSKMICEIAEQNNIPYTRNFLGRVCFDNARNTKYINFLNSDNRKAARKIVIILDEAFKKLYNNEEINDSIDTDIISEAIIDMCGYYYTPNLTESISENKEIITAESISEALTELFSDCGVNINAFKIKDNIFSKYIKNKFNI